MPRRKLCESASLEKAHDLTKGVLHCPLEDHHTDQDLALPPLSSAICRLGSCILNGSSYTPSAPAYERRSLCKQIRANSKSEKPESFCVAIQNLQGAHCEETICGEFAVSSHRAGPGKLVGASGSLGPERDLDPRSNVGTASGLRFRRGGQQRGSGSRSSGAQRARFHGTKRGRQ